MNACLPRIPRSVCTLGLLSLVLAGAFSLTGCNRYTRQLQALEGIRNKYDADARREGVIALANSPTASRDLQLAVFRGYIYDNDPTVRAACLKGLAIHGEPEDIALILPQLEDTSPVVRWEATKALKRIHGEAAVPALLKLVDPEHEPDDDVRIAAARALAQYPDPAVFDQLVSGLNDRTHGVAEASHDSLVTLTGYDFGSEPGPWLIWSQQNVDNKFEHRQPYRWQPYDRGPTLIDNITFWRDKEPEAPRPARGAHAG